MLRLEGIRVHVRRKTLFRLCTLAVMLVLLVSLFVAYFNYRLSPILATVAQEKARALLESAVNEALQSAMPEEGELVQHSYDSRGRLTLLTCDTVAANRLRTAISQAVLDALSDREYATFYVPFGNLLRGEVFSGRGPELAVRIVPVSSASVELQDSFSSAGINQTLFTLSAEINVRVSLILPLEKQAAELSLSCPLTQLIIAGDVPQVYLGA